ncbi:MAG TPA: flagellar biosynthesis protein FlgL [Devosiaceae bacterium]
MIVNNSFFPIATSARTITAMKQEMDNLQVQLGTGKKANSLAQLGTDTLNDVSLRARLTQMSSYQNSISTVNLRLDFLDNAMTALSDTQSAAKSSVAAGGGVTAGQAPSLARQQLASVIDVLNSDLNGRYMFGGSTTDQPPVASLDVLLNGSGGKAGFTQVAAERLAADKGVDGLGRLAIAQTGDTVTLGEDGVHPFGFKIDGLADSGSSATLTQPAGSPPASAVQFSGTPADKEVFSVRLKLPDGTTETIELQATSGDAGPGQFKIGAAGPDTAANFAAALGNSIEGLANTKLAAASAYAAADNFFNGPGGTPMRVDGPPFETATALVAGTPANTVQWYVGGDAPSAQNSVAARIDQSTTVGYGVQANETGIAGLMKNLAAMAISGFPNGDADAPARYQAMADRQLQRLSADSNDGTASLRAISLRLGLTRATVGDTRDRLQTYSTQMQGMLDDIEKAPPEEVAMKLLALQTQLQATFQTTANVAQLSLVNYLK